ncbi:MAG TPA: hypothetical protein IAA04_10965 [Candidatus Lachnoclostridium pullistercoris]|uniref:ABC-transporter type IV n=1 Tax=Candidatus Lachnoclostridium pullistercoris TaxID=2838632 RepID=A0A9D2PD07_9FIRM|nr:hypothetical protein [Candidatus Lachnoclostridium pullistercoris]
MKIMREMKKTAENFLKCGVAGWCLEVMFTAAESLARGDWKLMGRTSLIMFPIYGMGAFLGPIGRLADRWIGDGDISRRDRMVRHGMLYMVLIFLTEYTTGAWLTTRGICPWDYSGRHSNVNGLIRLDFAPLWFGTGLLFENLTKTHVNLTKKSRS